MNNVISTLVLFLFTVSIATAQEKHSLTITIPNATSDAGFMMIGVYEEGSFMKTDAQFAVKATIKDGVATATFNNVPTGQYAIMVLHDKNDNGRMDFENGMPAESYGISNNTMSYGPPTWSDAKFILNDNKTMTIRL